MLINDKLILDIFGSLVLSHLLIHFIIILTLAILVGQAASCWIRVWLLGRSEHHRYWSLLEGLGCAVANIGMLYVLLTWKHRSEMHSLFATSSIFSLRTKVLMWLLSISRAAAMQMNRCRKSLDIRILDITALMEERVSIARRLVWWNLVGAHVGWDAEWQHVIRWNLRLVSIIRITE